LILARIRQMQNGDSPFAGRSYYDENDKLKVFFG
jgi:hypothetical protein